jgi:hypothetical protein
MSKIQSATQPQEPEFHSQRAEVYSRLKERLTLDHFIIHFAWRDSGKDGGAGIRGVGGLTLVRAYAEGLERLHAHMRTYGRVSKAQQNFTHVYLYHLFDTSPIWHEPFTHRDKHNVPYIGLPCRNAEPGIADAFKRARSEATHEATHVFNLSARIALADQSTIRMIFQEPQWRWLDEATAIYMEQVCFPGQDDYLRYCMDWVDQPHLPLDSSGLQHTSCMYLKYIDQIFRKPEEPEGKFVSDIWQTTDPDETPCKAIARLARDRGHCPVSGALPGFAEFAKDSLFLGDPNSHGFSMDVFTRFGPPAIHERLCIGDNPQCELSHLSAKHFQIMADPTKPLKLELKQSKPNKYVRAWASISHRSLRTKPELEFLPFGDALRAILSPEYMAGGESVFVTVANPAIAQQVATFRLSAIAG